MPTKHGCRVYSIRRRAMTICFAMVSSRVGTVVFLLRWILSHLRSCAAGMCILQLKDDIWGLMEREDYNSKQFSRVKFIDFFVFLDLISIISKKFWHRNLILISPWLWNHVMLKIEHGKVSYFICNCNKRTYFGLYEFLALWKCAIMIYLFLTQKIFIMSLTL